MQTFDSCYRVRESCRQWMSDPQHQKVVSIQETTLKSFAQDILSKQQITSEPLSIEWDEEGWHYSPDSRLSRRVALERLALYILALDAINFCFWPSHSTNVGEDNFEYEHLAMALASMAKQDEEAQISMDALSPEYAFAPARLARLSVAEMASLFNTHLGQLSKHSGKPITPLDNVETRVKLWNEIGTVLMQKWEGNILQFLEVQVTVSGGLSCGLTAPQLVDRIAENFPGFRDHVPLATGDALYLHKRSQICVGDWNASLKLNLEHLDQLTTFADYRVPQLLRQFGVLQYGEDLAKKIDNQEEIPAASLEECSIRAATVVAVEELVEELNSLQEGAIDPMETFTAITVDWYLWQMGEQMHKEGTLKPHHKTRTTFY